MVKEGQKYLRPYEDPIPVVEDITGRRILKVAFLLFGGDEKSAESGSYCPSSNSFSKLWATNKVLLYGV